MKNKTIAINETLGVFGIIFIAYVAGFLKKVTLCNPFFTPKPQTLLDSLFRSKDRQLPEIQQ
jgi:hypothetical protein